MEFDDQRVDVSGVSDRRGSGGLGRGVAIGGGGLGLVGVVVVLLLQLLGGGAGGAGGGFDLTQLAPGTVTGGAPASRNRSWRSAATPRARSTSTTIVTSSRSTTRPTRSGPRSCRIEVPNTARPD